MKILTTAVLLFVFHLPLSAQIDYATQIDPIFSKYGCKGCHGGTGNLFLDSYQNLMTTGNSAPVVVASDTNSVLVKRLKGDGVSRMPFGAGAVDNADLRLIIEWILEGANAQPTSISTSYKPVATFALKQNYPNPFNPSTVIQYSIPISSHVLLKVYDILGKEVAVLIDEVKEAGNYSHKWNAAGLPSGIYFCKLHAGSNTATKKLILAK